MGRSRRAEEHHLMFESCYTPVDIAHLLRHRYGLPVELTADRATVVCGPRIGALDLPSALGRRVLGLLADTCPPVISDQRDTQWTFLIEPLMPSSAPRFIDLGVVPRRAGRRILLPMSDSGFGCRWASRPRPGPLHLPAGSDVLDAIERLNPVPSPQPLEACAAISHPSPGLPARRDGRSYDKRQHAVRPG